MKYIGNFSTIDEKSQKRTTKPNTLRGKNLPQVIIPDNEAHYKSTLEKQKGVKGTIILMSPDLYFYSNKYLMGKITDRFTEKFGPYLYGKIVEVPNKRNNVLYYTVTYDSTKSVDGIDSGD